MAATEMDPEALNEYRTLVQEQLDHLETIIPRLEKGNKLGRLPAFGQLDSAAAARTSYETFHKTTWNNLQALRESLNGILETLEDSAELAIEADETAASDMDDYAAELT
jgi:uncharacterized protein YjgD (DUF1641 family)